MDKLLTQEQLKELVLVTAETLRIKYPSIIEKDYYVTHAIHSLSGIENKYFRLIFGGGTCLAKAHRIVKRMSEDIDFKIQLKNTNETFSKSRLLKELKKFRTQIMESLTLPHLTISDSAVRNEGQYLRAELTYSALFTSNDTLRPHLLLEFTFADVRLATESLTISTIIEDIIKMDTIFSPLPIDCVSSDETAIEKWVGLTRRIAAIERQCHPDDETLVRHVYDLNAVHKAEKINDMFFNLARIIIPADAKQFKNQHPEYLDNPIAEIRHSLDILKNKSLWKERYHNFIETMVYENKTPHEYADSILILEKISEKVIEIFSEKN